MSELADNQSGQAGNVRCGHGGSRSEEVNIGGTVLSARADDQVEDKAESGYHDMAKLGLRGKDEIAARGGHVDDRLPEVAVGGQPVKDRGRVESEGAKANRSGGGDGHTVAGLRGNGEEPAVEVDTTVTGGAHD